MSKLAKVILALLTTIALIPDLEGGLKQFVDKERFARGLAELGKSLLFFENPLPSALLFILLVLIVLDFFLGKKKTSPPEPVDSESPKEIVPPSGGDLPPTERKPKPQRSIEEIYGSLKNLPLNRLRLGTEDELVGRAEAMKWLEERLITGKTAQVAVASVQGTGGVGKTFLAHAFAAEFGDGVPFLEIRIGDRPAMEAAAELLEEAGADTGMVRSEESMKELLQDFYSKNRGILILDDVWREDYEILLPRGKNWRVLLTTRDLELAVRSGGVVKELDIFSKEECLSLFRKVLGKEKVEAAKSGFEELSEFLAFRPYGIRLASESLRHSLTLDDPGKLLSDLGKFGIPEEEGPGARRRLGCLGAVLNSSLGQLEARSPLARRLVEGLAACEDSGMDVRDFLAWRMAETGEARDRLEEGLERARDLGLVLVEDRTFEFMGRDIQERTLRLHTDLLAVLRENFLEDERKSLHRFLKRTLVESPEGMEEKRGIQRQVFHLISFYGGDRERLEGIYWDFFEHLCRTGLLYWAHELGEKLMGMPEMEGSERDFAVILGNQALIHRAWGNLDQAMELLQKQEETCGRLGNQSGLSHSYGHQALIHSAWGRLNQAIELHRKEEEICGRLGDQWGCLKVTVTRL